MLLQEDEEHPYAEYPTQYPISKLPMTEESVEEDGVYDGVNMEDVYSGPGVDSFSDGSENDVLQNSTL